MTTKASLKQVTKQEIVALIAAMPEGVQKEAAQQYAVSKYGTISQTKKFAPFQFEPAAYIEKFLGWEPWSGTEKQPGQTQILEAYTSALRQQLERRDFEQGKIKEEDLRFWKPGDVVKNYIRVEAGHTVGKTKLESGLVNHFLDCFPKSVITMYGPSQDSLKDNLWQELLVDRLGKNLPGRILDSMEIRVGPNHYAKCRVTNDSHGKGGEKLQGKHPDYGLFILDEAEGIPNFVFEAIDSMTSGGISIVIMVANPKTRTSKFHKMQSVSNVRSFRMSCLHHPNVVAGSEIVPNAVRRHYVEMMVEKHCDIVSEHNSDNLTFELEFPLTLENKLVQAGTVFQPKYEFMFRVMGVAPPNLSERTVVTFGRFDTARKRPQSTEQSETARMGVDAARWGTDSGTLYVRHGANIWKAAEFPQQNSFFYWDKIRKEAFKLAVEGVTNLHIRIDGGGGFGGGVVDLLKSDAELTRAFQEYKVLEVQFGSNPHDRKKYKDLVTEMYFETNESLKSLCVINPAESLEIDLTEREYDWVNESGRSLRKLEAKDIFKKRNENRSPDDGDGFVLAASPDFIFRTVEPIAPIGMPKESVWHFR